MITQYMNLLYYFVILLSLFSSCILIYKLYTFKKDKKISTNVKNEVDKGWQGIEGVNELKFKIRSLKSETTEKFNEKDDRCVFCNEPLNSLIGGHDRLGMLILLSSLEHIAIFNYLGAIDEYNKFCITFNEPQKYHCKNVTCKLFGHSVGGTPYQHMVELGNQPKHLTQKQHGDLKNNNVW